MNWPPNPNSHDNQNNNDTQHSTSHEKPTHPNSKEWALIEKAMLANAEEQRKNRRWSIISKALSVGMLLLFMILMNRSCTTAEQASGAHLNKGDMNSPHLAVIDVNGVISADSEANAQDIVAAMTKAFENSNAKAVALNINSPGGSPVQSDEVWLAAKELREAYPDKNLYAVIGDLGASGAYYIASATDEIYVNPSSIVGSIGVIIASYDVQELMKKTGIKDRTMHAGEYKDILSMGRPMTEFEKQHIDGVLLNTHQHFIDAVKQGRGDRLKDPEQNKLFTGLFWTGEQAIELGLADKAGGISQLKQALDLTNSYNYTVVDPMKDIFDRFALKMGAGFATAVSDTLKTENGSAQLR